MSGCDCSVEIKNKAERKVLVILLIINAVMFVLEVAVGILSESTALIADSLDMLADATVYGVGLYAVGRSVASKIKAAYLSGFFQVLLGLTVFLDIVRRLLLGSEPEPMFMVVIGMAALVANMICLSLISKHRHGEVHMRASWIFSKNDVIANLCIILSGFLVVFFESRYPDLIAGIFISVLVIHGGVHIIRDSMTERKSLLAKSSEISDSQ